MSKSMRIALSLMAAAVLLAAAPLAAQTPADDHQGAPPEPPQGPMVVEPIAHSFVFVPDVRLSKVDGHSATLVGGYGGMVMDGHLLIGGGGYWLANNARDRELYYAGAVVGWYLFGGRRLDVSVMGFVGGGQGTAVFDLTDPHMAPFDRMADIRFGGGPHRPDQAIWSGPLRWAVRSNLFVAEPTASVVWRFAKNVGITGSVGYRLVAGAGSMNDQFRGVSGSAGIVFGGGR